MKKLLLLLFISNLSLAQQPHIEVRLVNPYVGTPLCDYFFNDWLCNTTNDAGLNTILSNHNVTYFRIVEGHPYPPYQGRIFNITPNIQSAQLVADLSAYSSVVDNAVLTTSEGFSDALYLTLRNAGIGIPTGTSGNVITTNDPGLNQIFQTYNVFQYNNYLSSSTNFTLTCDCDAVALKAALDAYTPVVAGTDAIQGVFLANPQFDKAKAVISPNPFSGSFDIQTDQSITNYSILDITGKTVVNTVSKNVLDAQSAQLSAGMYILNLAFENGQMANYKLVKK